MLRMYFRTAIAVWLGMALCQGLVYAQPQMIFPSDGQANARFGEKIEISGNSLIVSAPGMSAAYLYDRDPVSGQWIEALKLTYDDCTTCPALGATTTQNGQFTVTTTFSISRFGEKVSIGDGIAYVSYLITKEVEYTDATTGVFHSLLREGENQTLLYERTATGWQFDDLLDRNRFSEEGEGILDVEADTRIYEVDDFVSETTPFFSDEFFDQYLGVNSPLGGAVGDDFLLSIRGAYSADLSPTGKRIIFSRGTRQEILIQNFGPFAEEEFWPSIGTFTFSVPSNLLAGSLIQDDYAIIMTSNGLEIIAYDPNTGGSRGSYVPMMSQDIGAVTPRSLYEDRMLAQGNEEVLVFNGSSLAAQIPAFLGGAFVVDSFELVQTLLAPVAGIGFGADIDEDGQTIVVSAPSGMSNGAPTGVAYVYGTQFSLPAPTNLVADNGTAFIVPLSWEDNASEEDGYKLYRDGGLIADLPPNTTQFVDNVQVFGTPVTYEVVAYKGGNESDPSNLATYAMPASFQELELSFVCFDINTYELTWNVYNPNSQAHPYIYAQWWSTQRDTLLAAPGNSTFQTIKNPQDRSTYGDDNITGIWYAIENGESTSDLVMRARLGKNRCDNARRAEVPASAQAGSILKEQLGTIDLQTGPTHAWLEDHIRIGPNPVTATLQIQAEELDQVNILVQNPLGQDIFTQFVESASTVELDLTELPKGTYLLTLQHASWRFTQKIIKE